MRCIMAGTFSHFKFMEDLSVNLGFDKPKELFLIAGQGHDLLSNSLGYNNRIQ